MKKFHISRILIPVDFSETSLLALEHAVLMAKLLKAEITLLHVIESLTYTSAIGHSAVNDFEAEVEKSANARLAELAAKLSREGATVKTMIEVGRIYRQVVEAALKIKADLVIMGTHGVSGFREFLIGSNASRVVSEAACPVITVQSHAKTIGFKNIVLPIDNTQYSRQKVRYAHELADKYGSKVHLLGILPAEGVEEENKFRIKIRQVEEYLSKHNIVYTSGYLSAKGGNAAKTALDYATSVNGDLLMIMSESEFDSSGLLLGPSARQTVNHSTIPVMCVAPDVNYTGVDLHGYGF